MKCPSCNYAKTIIFNSRERNDGAEIWRRRECPRCDTRFSTMESVHIEDTTHRGRGKKLKPARQESAVMQ